MPVAPGVGFLHLAHDRPRGGSRGFRRPCPAGPAVGPPTVSGGGRPHRGPRRRPRLRGAGGDRVPPLAQAGARRVPRRRRLLRDQRLPHHHAAAPRGQPLRSHRSDRVLDPAGPPAPPRARPRGRDEHRGGVAREPGPARRRRPADGRRAHLQQQLARDLGGVRLLRRHLAGPVRDLLVPRGRGAVLPVLAHRPRGDPGADAGRRPPGARGRRPRRRLRRPDGGPLRPGREPDARVLRHRHPPLRADDRCGGGLRVRRRRRRAGPAALAAAAPMDRLRGARRPGHPEPAARPRRRAHLPRGPRARLDPERGGRRLAPGPVERLHEAGDPATPDLGRRAVVRHLPLALAGDPPRRRAAAGHGPRVGPHPGERGAVPRGDVRAGRGVVPVDRDAGPAQRVPRHLGRGPRPHRRRGRCWGARRPGDRRRRDGAREVRRPARGRARRAGHRGAEPGRRRTRPRR